MEPAALDPVDEGLLAEPGLALRHALDSVDAGELERSEKLLAAIGARHPVIADYADLERLRLYVLTERFEEALALGDGWPHPDSPLSAEVYVEVARARAARGAHVRLMSARSDRPRIRICAQRPSWRSVVRCGARVDQKRLPPVGSRSGCAIRSLRCPVSRKTL